MFEDQTYEVILERMLSRMPDDIDKREGSFAFDAVAPASLEVAQVYHLMSIMYRLVLGESTDGDMLELRAANFGVFRKLATWATRKGVFTNSDGFPMENIEIGSRFTVDDVNFVVTEKVAVGNYIMKSESSGIIGNQPYGSMLPIESIDGLGTAELTDVLIAGIDEQSDEDLAIALAEKQSRPAASGSEYDYVKWAKEVNGVHDAKVYENWNGPNTVKVVVINAEKRSPSPLVITQTKDYIESVRPVGAIVTVVGVVEKAINIDAKLTTQPDADGELVKQSISDSVVKYFESIAGLDNTVRYTAIGNAILDGIGVIDYTDLKVAGLTGNVILDTDEVPIIGTITLT